MLNLILKLKAQKTKKKKTKKENKIENLVFRLFTHVFLVIIGQSYFSSQKLSILV